MQVIVMLIRALNLYTSCFSGILRSSSIKIKLVDYHQESSNLFMSWEVFPSNFSTLPVSCPSISSQIVISWDLKPYLKYNSLAPFLSFMVKSNKSVSFPHQRSLQLDYGSPIHFKRLRSDFNYIFQTWVSRSF